MPIVAVTFARIIYLLYYNRIIGHTFLFLLPPPHCLLFGFRLGLHKLRACVRCDDDDYYYYFYYNIIITYFTRVCSVVFRSRSSSNSGSGGSGDWWCDNIGGCVSCAADSARAFDSPRSVTGPILIRERARRRHRLWPDYRICVFILCFFCLSLLFYLPVGQPSRASFWRSSPQKRVNDSDV